MGLFDNILDDTTEVKVEFFGELILLLREKEVQKYEIVRYALKHGILPDRTLHVLHDDKYELYHATEHYYFIKRANRYIPKVEKWCKDNKITITNLNIIKEGKYPKQYEYLNIPDRPEFRLSFPIFLIKNWNIILNFYFSLILLITIVGTKFGYQKAINSINQLVGIYNTKKETSIMYLIATMPLIICVGYVISLIFKSL